MKFFKATYSLWVQAYICLIKEIEDKWEFITGYIDPNDPMEELTIVEVTEEEANNIKIDLL